MMGAGGAVIWLVVAVVLFVVEGATAQMLCIWFAFGSLAAMLASFAGAPLFLQLALFLVTSVSVLVLGRPLLKRKLTPEKTATNADALIGRHGVVTENIDNMLDAGRVNAGGLGWAARGSAEDEKIPAGQRVRILRIDGVKLIVEPIKQSEVEVV